MGPRPDRDREVGLIEPRSVPREVVHHQEKERNAEQGTDLPDVRAVRQ